MKEHQRFMRLQHLLEKSSIYSKFLLQRMENQLEEEKKQHKKQAHKKKIVSSSSAKANGEQGNQEEKEVGGDYFSLLGFHWGAFTPPLPESHLPVGVQSYMSPSKSLKFAPLEWSLDYH